MPWSLPDDLRFFKKKTISKPVIMGRRTHESIGRSLPGRFNIVVTHQSDYKPFDGSEVAHSIDNAIQKAKYAIDCLGYENEIMVIGGAEVFNQMFELADRVFLTEVDGEFGADAVMRPIDYGVWREQSRNDYEKNGKNSHAFSLVELSRSSKKRKCAA